MGARIVLVGAGSSSFGYKTLLDAVNSQGLKGSTIVLHDIDAEKLALMMRVAGKLKEKSGADLTFTSSTSREEALDGADFVVVSIGVDRMNRWRRDWEIPYKHGIKQVIGENGGPGGLFHTLRMVPPIIEIARDMERLCPDALMLNYTNPVPRLCLAVKQATRIRVVGLCHEVEHQLQRIAKVMEVPTQILDEESAGLNHFSWFTKLQFKDGSDAYPLLAEKAGYAKGFQPLCHAAYRKFGLYPSTDDNHLGEYLAYAWESCPPELRGLSWIERQEREAEETRRLVEGVADGSVEPGNEKSGEAAVRIISGILRNSNHREPQVNLPNEGQVGNLIQSAVVESPATISKTGVHPTQVGDLPQSIAALCNMQILIQGLAVEAALRGDRKLALRAVLADPVVQDNVAAEQAFRELLEAHRDLLPQFKEEK
jgi:alpha-galactosidase